MEPAQTQMNSLADRGLEHLNQFPAIRSIYLEGGPFTGIGLKKVSGADSDSGCLISSLDGRSAVTSFSINRLRRQALV
jgi:hypothetical protein